MPSLRWVAPLAALVLAACGGGGGSTAATSGSTASSGSHNYSAGGANVVPLVVGPGPTNQTSFNIPTTSVKVCVHGTSTCTTISNVLVDTGSPGLRLMASALGSFSLPHQQDPTTGSNFIVECLPFADGYTWGPVATADVTVGGETASNVPVNVIDDTASGTLEPQAPSSCTGSGSESNLSSVDALGANGVLGVGLFNYDCGDYCTQPVLEQTDGYLYYSCSVSTCSATTEALADQVVNPVARFATDNNGVILQLPAIPTQGKVSDSGYLVFGIGTQTNNGLGSVTVLTTSESGYITTLYGGQTLSSSFLDSGSNGYFFPDSTITVCSGFTGASDFYCPTNSPLSLSASNEGQNGSTTQISFQIDNLNDLNQTYFAVNVGGPITGITGLGTSNFFDFGVPFFYGRTVFTAIAGASAGGTTGPYYAY
ncbi:MAG: DUF3443 domain-containing protein [Steroidobacteraceae bacterium]